MVSLSSVLPNRENHWASSNGLAVTRTVARSRVDRYRIVHFKSDQNHGSPRILPLAGSVQAENISYTDSLSSRKWTWLMRMHPYRSA